MGHQHLTQEIDLLGIDLGQNRFNRSFGRSRIPQQQVGKAQQPGSRKSRLRVTSTLRPLQRLLHQAESLSELAAR